MAAASPRLAFLSDANGWLNLSALADDAVLGTSLVAEPFEAVVKGFDEERFALWRATPAGSSVNRLEPMPVG